MLDSIIRFLDLRGRHVCGGLAALGCALVLAGCAGGSGSSGFDFRAENRAIDTALETNDCTVNAGLTICPSGIEIPSPPSASPTVTAAPATASPTSPVGVTTATPTPTFTLPVSFTPTSTRPAASATPTVTPIPTLEVLADVGRTDQVACTPSAADGPCLFLFAFEPRGFPAETAFGVAYRTRNPDGEWVVVAAPNHSATVALTPGVEYQFAVLVFPASPDPNVVTVGALALTDATYAFVTPSVIATTSF